MSVLLHYIRIRLRIARLRIWETVKFMYVGGSFRNRISEGNAKPVRFGAVEWGEGRIVWRSRGVLVSKDTGGK